MAGTVTETTRNLRKLITRITMAWVSDASGAVNGTSIKPPAGWIESVRLTPDGGGTQPSDQYDLSLLDPRGVDVLFGAGADLSNAAAKVTRLDPPYWQGGEALTLTITNAGNAKGGTVELVVRQ